MTINTQITFSRGNFLLDMNCTFDGSLFGLAGPSGSGKTTFLQLLAGLLRPDRGYIEMDGRVLFDSGRKYCAAPENRRVGLVFQDFRLFPHLTVRKNLLYGFTRRKSRLSLPEAAEAFGLVSFLDRYPFSLSGGECQRTVLARALLSGPELLLLDEPFTSQDRVLRQKMILYLKMIREKWDIPIILVSHDDRDLFSLTDTILCMDKGRISVADEGEGRGYD